MANEDVIQFYLFFFYNIFLDYPSLWNATGNNLTNIGKYLSYQDDWTIHVLIYIIWINHRDVAKFKLYKKREFTLLIVVGAKLWNSQVLPTRKFKKNSKIIPNSFIQSHPIFIMYGKYFL